MHTQYTYICIFIYIYSNTFIYMCLFTHADMHMQLSTYSLENHMYIPIYEYKPRALTYTFKCNIKFTRAYVWHSAHKHHPSSSILYI